ncbi:Radical SAM domain protein [Methanosalsum zhilinae DSM 4017]|uniref:Radical SAM domain protein n=1 Tax=Methanosalsum zhilinae (strain DSM 4017 / NBRC 107636 / OCM 62 / WeN5) TaxID=679901 RepID=F7XQC7_METZD|nr:radical SAM protein [Methanosalsum zhilinae]AEH61593.1 Radical SAM domain protein [Methanosalsum zhilinae DSM 4017]
MKSIKSLCPECHFPIDGKLFEEHGKLMVEKTCSEHGSYRDIYWSDADLFHRFDKYSVSGDGLSNPITSDDSHCPENCGICSAHRTTTILANIDVTNRCNMKCPVCFSNSNAKGYLYEPSRDQIRDMLEILRNEKPVRCFSVQFSGGEPTVRSDLPDIVSMARQMGFIQIQIATNGIVLARNLDFAKKLHHAGLDTVYLQFDGVSEEPYLKTRGFNVFPIKEKAIENCRKANIRSIALVPTLAKGVNDHQVGDMIDFASQRLDVVKGINFQPMAFTGRVDQDTRENRRITIPDLIKLVEDQTDGQVNRDAWYPVPFVVPISRFISLMRNTPVPELSCHPHCGTGTYVFVENGKLIPITDFVDVEGMTEFLTEIVEENNENNSRLKSASLMAKAAYRIPSFIDQEKAPRTINVKKLFTNFFTKGTVDVTKEFHRNALFLGSMHFQDMYNFDIERVQRCGVHYATPDGRLIPFCTYNIFYRDEIEEKFSIPLNSAAGISSRPVRKETTEDKFSKAVTH